MNAKMEDAFYRDLAFGTGGLRGVIGAGTNRINIYTMPADPVMVTTIVTMDMAQQIAEHYGLRTINVLTGFKFIGEQIGKLEEQKKADSYVFGFTIFISLS